jgi:hypothetical protein
MTRPKRDDFHDFAPANVHIDSSVHRHSYLFRLGQTDMAFFVKGWLQDRERASERERGRERARARERDCKCKS